MPVRGGEVEELVRRDEIDSDVERTWRLSILVIVAALAAIVALIWHVPAPVVWSVAPATSQGPVSTR